MGSEIKGWSRGDISIERHAVEGRPEQLPALMQQVIDVGVDVIVTFGGPGVRAAQSATDRIAIVAVVDGVLDTGTVESLRRPGRNLTGIGENSSAIEGKRLQILKEAAPAISRVAVITYARYPEHDPVGALSSMRPRALGTLQVFPLGKR